MAVILQTKGTSPTWNTEQEEGYIIGPMHQEAQNNPYMAIFCGMESLNCFSSCNSFQFEYPTSLSLRGFNKTLLEKIKKVVGDLLSLALYKASCGRVSKDPRRENLKKLNRVLHLASYHASMVRQNEHAIISLFKRKDDDVDTYKKLLDAIERYRNWTMKVMEQSQNPTWTQKVLRFLYLDIPYHEHPEISLDYQGDSKITEID